MNEVNDSLQAAVANAANKIAEADTVEEAQQWQSVISNLVSAQTQVGQTPVATSPREPVSSFEEVVANADGTEEVVDATPQLEESNDN